MGAFIGLDASSLWKDELFSAHFADPEIAKAPELIERAAESVNPPGYYLLLWATMRSVGGDFTVIARALSASLAVISLLILYRALPREVGRFERLFACAFAASSPLWYLYSQEARAYALVFVLVSLLIWIAFRVQSALREGHRPTLLLCAFTLVATAGSLVHYYIVPLAGGMVATLILVTRGWRARAALALAGVAILPPVLVFIDWHVERVVVDVTRTWFQADPDFVLRNTSIGVTKLLGSVPHILIVILLGISALSLLVRKGLRLGRESWSSTMLLNSMLLVGSGIIAIGLSVTVTMLFIPSYSFRMFVVIAPLFWALLGVIMSGLARNTKAHPTWPTVGILLTLLTIQSAAVYWRGVPIKPTWRASAQAVAQLPECARSPLPVLWLEQPHIGGNGAAHFYGYYLPDGAEREWLVLPRDRVQEALQAPPIAEVISNRISGTDPCPLLLWAVETSAETVESVRRSIEMSAATTENADIALRTFETPSPSLLRGLLGVGYRDTSFQIYVQRN